MTTVIKLLKRELREWKKNYRTEKNYWKEATHKADIACGKKFLAAAQKNISELEQAIKILSK